MDQDATSLKTDLNEYLRAELRGITSVKSGVIVLIASVDVQRRSKIPDLDLSFITPDFPFKINVQ
jgi:hypothetical protein